ncbi:hypothetical protein B9479_002792 [Cryptococcus floricola]|uniref:Uncharacterized protein n=1 Tax=Cryptococcus floricola TaxID=2591691 RepID=A0A5D3AYW8_9TREE|nr:hypothetical protein B9479_002792 [Cryptococcus floricola]
MNLQARPAIPHSLLGFSTEYTPVVDGTVQTMFNVFRPAREIKTELGRYRLLSPSAAM